MNGRILSKGFALSIIFILTAMDHSVAATVVIDPGHGGHDHGAEARIKTKSAGFINITEKDLALSVAKQLKRAIKKNRPDLNVYLTRQKDEFLTLVDRGRFAQLKEADLFISIHCNSHNLKGSKGFETYVLNNATDKAAKKLEEYENSVDGVNSDLDWILMDLVINENIQESAKLAGLIQKNVSKGTRKKGYELRNRGVKQALLSVLYHARTPGVLVELGFMSNPKELDLLTKNTYQKALVQSMEKAITHAFPRTELKQTAKSYTNLSL